MQTIGANKFWTYEIKLHHIQIIQEQSCIVQANDND
jgi:hypothetical protein